MKQKMKQIKNENNESNESNESNEKNSRKTPAGTSFQLFPIVQEIILSCLNDRSALRRFPDRMEKSDYQAFRELPFIFRPERKGSASFNFFSRSCFSFRCFLMAAYPIKNSMIFLNIDRPPFPLPSACYHHLLVAQLPRQTRGCIRSLPHPDPVPSAAVPLPGSVSGRSGDGSGRGRAGGWTRCGLWMHSPRCRKSHSRDRAHPFLP